MSYIDMHARHSMSRDDAQAAADELAGDLARKFDIDYGWEGDHILFERPGVNLSLIHISEPTRQLMSSRMPSSA